MNPVILYLEDDDALAEVTARALLKRHFNVQHYLTIDAVRQALATSTFSYVLLDLKVGNETSLQLIQEIKKVKDVPIVILTGYGTVRTAVHAMKLGAINFLSKPCAIDEVIAAFEGNIPQEKVPDIEVKTPSLKSVEWEAIQKALDDNEGNISAAARQLKMHRRSLQRKLVKRHIE